VRCVALFLVLACSCHSEAPATAPTVPDRSGSAAAATAGSTSTASGTASSEGPAASVALDQALHFESGQSGKAEGVSFTVRMLPKLIVSGPPHEIEQVQIECVRGAERGVVQIDTLEKRAEWGGITFELGYADVYKNDIMLTVRRR
jgi:hypothetical protein